MVIYMYDIEHSKRYEKSGKREIRNKVIRNSGRENGNFFPKNLIQKSWSGKKLSVTQNRRQVSAPLLSITISSLVGDDARPARRRGKSTHRLRMLITSRSVGSLKCH